MIRKVVSAFSVAALLLSACAKVDETQVSVSGGEKVDGSYATKVVNTSKEADENTLLLVLTESAAQTLAQGGEVAELAAVCSQTGALRVERLFVSNNDLARSKGLHKWYLVTFDGPRNSVEMAKKFADLSSVEYIQYNTKVYRNFLQEGGAYNYEPKGFGDFNVPFNDPLLCDQWHYINHCDLSVAETSRQGADINVKDAWRLCAGDPNIIVAICDEGVKYSHPDLAPNMWTNPGEIPDNDIDDDNNGYVDDIHGWNFLSTEEFPKEIDWTDVGDKGHGTHVAGTVAAVNNNGIGVGGVAGGSGKGDGVRMMSCQVFSGNSSATVAARARAYEYAANNGACIIQCSFGLSGGMITSDGAFEKTYHVELAGIEYFVNYRQAYSPVDKNFAIFASGNDAYHLAGYPAAHRDVISVSAFGPDFLPAVYTNYGPGNNIAAPGGDATINMSAESDRAMILSTVPSDCPAYDTDYGYMQGTSMACPHVSGVIALGLSYAKKLGKKFTRAELTSLLLTSVTDIDQFNTGKSHVFFPPFSQQGTTIDMNRFKGQMGTGAVDAWKFLMAIEGTPTILTQAGKKMSIDISSYCNPHDDYRIVVDDATKNALGLESDPVVRNGKLEIECTKVGSGKIMLNGKVGKDPEKEDGIGDMSYSRTLSVASRPFATNNGGWL